MNGNASVSPRTRSSKVLGDNGAVGPICPPTAAAASSVSASDVDRTVASGDEGLRSVESFGDEVFEQGGGD